MEKRLPLALLLCLLFVFIYNDVILRPPAGQQTDVVSAPAVSQPVPGVSGQETMPSLGSALADTPAASIPEQPSEAVSFIGEGFEATFETRGAGLSLLSLDNYHPTVETEELFSLLGAVSEDRWSLLLRDLDGDYDLDRVVWEVASKGRGDAATLVFSHQTEDGLRFSKTIAPTHEPYTFRLGIEVANVSHSEEGTLNLVLSGPEGVLDDSGVAFAIPPRAFAVVQGNAAPEFTDWSGGDLQQRDAFRVPSGEGLVSAGVMTTYFASALVPLPGTYVSQVLPRGVLDRNKLEIAVDEQNPATEEVRSRLRDSIAHEHYTNASVDLALSHKIPSAGEKVQFDLLVYAGPKDRALATQPGYAFLQTLVEEAWGGMSWINRTLLFVLDLFEGLAGNWGVAIILLTVLVRVVLFPLSRVQQSSMMKYSSVMQQLKPQIDELKAKYKSNPKKLNQEQMKLMQEHGARPPLGGCLLMLLQFPIWISLFQVLRSSIELRHAHFFGWVTDLSQPDRLPLGFGGMDTINLLPILMGLAMLGSMKAQPIAGDDQARQQQKIMAVLMPLMMLWFLYSYPAGLALYILTSSLLGIVEVKIIRRKFPLPGPTPAPAGGEA